MPDSQNPEHVRKIVAEFQLKGQNLIPTVTGEIVPTVLVADLTAEARAEDRLAWGGQLGVASGAGNQNKHLFQNPAASGTLVMLDRIAVVTAAADAFHVRTVAGASGSANEGTWRDLRISGEPVALFDRVAAGATVIDPIQFVSIDNADLGHVWLELGIYLTPNTHIVILQNAQNAIMNVVYQWRERDLRTGE